MSCWWQDLNTGVIHEVADHATAHREALDHTWSTGNYVYVSNTRIPEGHAQWWRDRGCPSTLEIRTHLAPRPELEAWDAEPVELHQPRVVEPAWDAEVEDVWSV